MASEAGMSKPKNMDGKPSIFDEDAVTTWLYREHDVRDEAATAARIVRLAARAVKETTGDVWTTMDEISKKAGLRTTVIKTLRHFGFVTSKERTRRVSKDATTTKFLLTLKDGNVVEAVVMHHTDRTTVCVSSQVGCQMGCQFCATGTLGKIRNLSGPEIIDQYVVACLDDEGRKNRKRPSNVVFMGQGEPLANYDNVATAVRLLTSIFQLRAKAVTVSTVGVVPAMRRFTEEFPDVSLALSLHAPTQSLRETIVPASRAWPLSQLLSAVDEHLEKTAKRHRHSAGGMMIEYVLLRDVNDRFEDATALAELLRDKNVMINLIPYNPNLTAGIFGFSPPSIDHARTFGKVLIDAGLRARLRQEHGADINAACGQLAAVDRMMTSTDIEDIVPPPLRQRPPRRTKDLDDSVINPPVSSPPAPPFSVGRAFQGIAVGRPRRLFGLLLKKELDIRLE